MSNHNQRVTLKGVEIFPFATTEELIDHMFKYKGLLLGVDANVVMRSSDETRQLINRHTGVAFDYLTALAVRNGYYKSRNARQFDKSRLWLQLVYSMYVKREGVFIISDNKTVLDKTVLKLKCDHLGLNITVFNASCNMLNKEIKEIEASLKYTNPRLVLVQMKGEQKFTLMEELFQKQHVVYIGIDKEFEEYIGNKEKTNNLAFIPIIKNQLFLLKYLFLIIANRI